MQWSLFRVAALVLCTSALSACSMMAGGDKVAASAPRPADANAVTLAADVTSAIAQAQAMRAKGDLDGEMHIISQLMLVQPDDARVVGEYGKLLVQQGRASDAAQFLRRAVELSPSDWTFYSALGVAYDQMGDPANAKLAYEHALALKPGEAAILNNYGMSRMLAGDTDAARALMTQAKASGSTDPKIASNLALLESTAPKPAPAPVAVLTAPVAHPTTISAIKPVVISHAQTPAANHLPTPVVSKPMAPVATTAAVAAPTPITRNGVSVVMQAVPVDPKAGPVAHAVAKPVKVAAKSAPVNVAATVAPKASAKPAPLDRIPALRMTADAGKP